MHSEKALEARKGVLEMLLINHPLDCPICDQAGECELQDYTYQEGRAEGRYRDPKRFNPVEDFGGDVMYTPNRCILCTRCVRFMEDVAHDPVLNVSERGDRAVIGKFEGQGHDAPVGGERHRPLPGRRAAVEGFAEQGARLGARPHGVGVHGLLAGLQHDRRDARQHGRPSSPASQRRREQVLHVRPRSPELPLDEPPGPRRRADGACRRERWAASTGRSRSPRPPNVLRGKKAFVLASPMLSNEALFLLSELADKTGGSGAFRVQQGDEAPLPGVEDLSLRADRAANARGAELFGFTRSDKPLASLGSRRRARSSPTKSWPASMRRTSPRPARSSSSARRCPRGRGMPPPSFFRSRTSPKKRGRSRIFAAECSASCRRKAAPGFARPSWYVLSDLLRALGRRHQLLARERSLRRDREGASGLHRHELRHARPQGSHDRRRDGGGGVMTALRPAPGRGGRRRRQRSSTWPQPDERRCRGSSPRS